MQSVPFFLLFGSGLAALTYQVVWMREFRLVFGASTASTAAVSALFMAGLGIGGWLLGGRADRVRRPLLMYGVLELAIALLAAISPWLMLYCREYYLETGGMIVLGEWGALAARLALAAAVLGIPTILMGGTLPAAVRAVTAESDGSRRSLGLLYGTNTLGALTGTVLTNFFLMERFGAQLTLFIAVGLNIVVAVVAIVMSTPQTSAVGIQSETGAESAESSEVMAPRTTEAEKAPEEVADSEGRPLSPALVLATAAGVGFAFFLMELVWYRMLSPVLGGSTYTFGLILAVALGGIGLGGAAYPLLIGKRRVTSSLLALTCLLEALAMMIPYVAGDRIPMATMQIMPLSSLGFLGQVGIWVAVTLFVVFPAAFISGLQFPLLIALLGQGSKNIGVQTGRAYALNTAGAIAGSLAGGFGLMPGLTAPGCWLLAGGILCLLGILIGLHAWRNAPAAVMGKSQPAAVVGLVAVVLLLPSFLATGPTAAWRHTPVGAGRAKVGESKNDVLAELAATRTATYWEAEGVESSVALINTRGLTFFINGKSDGNIYGDRGTQIMSGILGPALHPNPKRAMVVGLGTGCTAGWLSAIEGMEQVDVVELEPAVLEMGRLCAAGNHDIMEKAATGKGVRIIINDAREVLCTVPEKYDIVVSEPSNPYRAGIASMYTKEYYEAVRDRLAPGGIFHSWCQAYEINAGTAVTVMATLKSVFPYVECWFTQVGDLAFLASMEPIRPDVEKLKSRLQEKTYRDAMRIAWRQEGLEGFVSHFIARSSFVDQMARTNTRGINTDDLMLVEYDYARTVGKQTNFSMFQVMSEARLRRMSTPEWLPKDIDVGTVVDNFFLSWPLGDASVYFESGIPAALIQRLQALEAWRQNNYAATASLPEEFKRTHRIEYLALAESLAQLGDEKALEYISSFEDWWPACAAVVRAHLALRTGEFSVVADELEKAYALFRLSPWEVDEVIIRSFKTMEELLQRNPHYAPRMCDALAEPFPLFMVELARRGALLLSSGYVDYKKQEEVLQRWFEPNPPWFGSVLTTRVECYRHTNNPRLGRAVLDLENYNNNTSLTLGKMLQNFEPPQTRNILMESAEQSQ